MGEKMLESRRELNSDRLQRHIYDRSVAPVTVPSVPNDAVLTSNDWRDTEQQDPDQHVQLRLSYGQDELIFFSDTIIPQIFIDILKSLWTALSLPEDWNSYKTKPIKVETIVRCMPILQNFLDTNAVPPQIFPTAKGGFSFEWHTPRVELEVEVTPEGRVLVCYENLETHTELENDVTANPSVLRDLVPTQDVS